MVFPVFSGFLGQFFGLEKLTLVKLPVPLLLLLLGQAGHGLEHFETAQVVGKLVETTGSLHLLRGELPPFALGGQSMVKTHFVN